MKKPWCVDPFIQMAHTADGYYNVCCIGGVNRITGPTTLQMTPLEYWNSAEARQIRSDMLSGKFSEITKEITIDNVDKIVQEEKIYQIQKYLNIIEISK